jgi:hypothetical protein
MKEHVIIIDWRIPCGKLKWFYSSDYSEDVFLLSVKFFYNLGCYD